MKLFLKISACAILAVITTVFSFAVYAVSVTANVRFYDEKLSAPSSDTEFFDAADNLVPSASESPSAVSLKELPPFVKYAFIAIEDKRFYLHRGIDFKRIASAFAKNLKSGKYVEGASTISQQLIKNTHLSNEKTIKRKLQEIKLTKMLERKYSKDEILEKYLGTIYFGEGAYGIERASEVYFGKSARFLDLSEAALLAAVIKAPSAYSPVKNPKKALGRRDLVLTCMLEQGYIGEKEYKSATEAEFIPPKNNSVDTSAPYFNEVKRELGEILETLPFGFYEKYNVYTYYDPALTETLYREIADQSPKNDYFCILTDNRTHSVTAVAANVSMQKRCPASTVKPWLVYAPAIEEEKITIASKISDEKTDFNGYCPRNNNDAYHGFISAKDALSLSLNVPAVKVLNCLGQDRAGFYAEKMNVSAEGGLGVALGGFKEGMRLKEICDCYSVFSSGGNFYEGKFIKRITAKDGKTIYENKPLPKRIFSEGTAFIINDALYASAKSGTAKKLRDLPFSVCAKTGTNGTKNGNTDAYCISYSPEFILGMWYGNADNTLMPNSVSGGTYPTIISGEIWKYLSSENKITVFEKPAGVAEARLDERKYSDDHALFLGDDGPSFYFLGDTKPTRTANRKEVSEIKNIQQSCDNGVYKLGFVLSSYDGAEIYSSSGKENRIVYDFNVNGECEYSCNVKIGVEYTFSIRPYRRENGKKIYGETVELKKIKYKPQDKKIPPPDCEWWADN